MTRWQFQLHYPYMWPHASRYVLRVATREFGGGRPQIWLPVARFLRGYQLGGGYTPGPLLPACAFGGLAGAVVSLRRRLSPRRRELTRACFVFFVTIAGVLVVSDVFVFSWRYQLPAPALPCPRRVRWRSPACPGGGCGRQPANCQSSRGGGIASTARPRRPVRCRSPRSGRRSGCRDVRPARRSSARRNRSGTTAAGRSWR